jgi:hypothetical protein
MNMDSYQIFSKVLSWQQTPEVLKANDKMVENNYEIARGFVETEREILTLEVKKMHRAMLRKAEAYLGSAHIFEVSDKQKHLLMLTRPMKMTKDIFRQIRLPFPETFIDVNLEIDEQTTIHGILLKEINHLSWELNPEGKKINYSTSPSLTAFICKLGGNASTIMECGLEIDEVKQTKKLEKKLNKELFVFNIEESVQKFVFNFLCFLNDPEITYIERKRDTSTNQRRAKQGKIPLPTSNVIQLTGQIKRYVDSISDTSFKGKYSHRFYVRGHFRNLRAERYKEKKMIWIPPFIKGQIGLLLPKRYAIKKEGQKKILYYEDIK